MVRNRECWAGWSTSPGCRRRRWQPRGRPLLPGRHPALSATHDSAHAVGAARHQPRRPVPDHPLRRSRGVRGRLRVGDAHLAVTFEYPRVPPARSECISSRGGWCRSPACRRRDARPAAAGGGGLGDHPPRSWPSGSTGPAPGAMLDLLEQRCCLNWRPTAGIGLVRARRDRDRARARARSRSPRSNEAAGVSSTHLAESVQAPGRGHAEAARADLPLRRGRRSRSTPPARSTGRRSPIGPASTTSPTSPRDAAVHRAHAHGVPRPAPPFRRRASPATRSTSGCCLPRLINEAGFDFLQASPRDRGEHRAHGQSHHSDHRVGRRVHRDRGRPGGTAVRLVRDR